MHRHYSQITRLTTIVLALQNELDNDELTKSNLCQLWNIGLNIDLWKRKQIKNSVFSDADIAAVFSDELGHIESIRSKDLTDAFVFEHLGDDNALGVINAEYTLIIQTLIAEVSDADESSAWILSCIRHQISMHKNLCRKAIYLAVCEFGVTEVTELLRVNTAYVRRMHDQYAEEFNLDKLST